MNEEKDNKLDDLFRKGIEDPANEAAFNERDWDAMEQMLDNGKKRRSAIIFWLPVIGSAAALVIIFLGYLFLNQRGAGPDKNKQSAAVHSHRTDSASKTGYQAKNNAGTSGEPARDEADSSKQKIHTAQYAVTPAARKGQGQNGKSFFSLSSGKGRRDAAGNRPDNSTISSPGLNDNEPVIANNSVQAKNLPDKTSHSKVGIGQADDKSNPEEAIAANSDPSKGVTNKTSNSKVGIGQADEKKNVPDAIAANSTKKADIGDKTKVKEVGRHSGNPVVFAFGVIASSDLNGVNSAFQQSKVGGNFGVTFSVGFAKKWTVSTGAMYDIKPYLTGFNNYHTGYQFKTQPTSVDANCRMLDIPVNVNYQVYSRRANKITLGTGLSSYFMLREDYRFNYANTSSYGYPGTISPSTYTVINKNRNILSVLNLDATYTHQINPKLGITVQPYLKVPLSDVGASQVRLQSTGVALGLSWNINASPKPK
jgi:hypothetical protein